IQTFLSGSPVRAVACHPDNTHILSAGDDGKVTVHALSLVRTVAASTRPLHALAVTPNGAHLLTTDDAGAVKAWGVNTPREERAFAGAAGPVRAVAVSRNGQLVATAADDKQVRVYHLADGKLHGAFAAPAPVHSLSFHSDGSVLAGGDDRALTTWNVAP